MDTLSILARTALFDGFAAAELEPLAAALKARTFARGSSIFHEGDPANALYIIRSGQVKISRMGQGGDEVVFAVLVPGESFGELALFEPGALRTADAQAMELTDCLSLGRDPLIAFLDGHPAVLRHLLTAVTGYVRRSNETVAEVAFLDIPGRVARKLLALAESHGERTQAGIRIRMRLSQRTLAGMVAASRENVNRALQRFTGHGDIEQEGGMITIVRPAELRKRC